MTLDIQTQIDGILTAAWAIRSGDDLLAGGRPVPVTSNRGRLAVVRALLAEASALNAEASQRGADCSRRIAWTAALVLPTRQPNPGGDDRITLANALGDLDTPLALVLRLFLMASAWSLPGEQIGRQEVPMFFLPFPVGANMFELGVLVGRNAFSFTDGFLAQFPVLVSWAISQQVRRML